MTQVEAQDLIAHIRRNIRASVREATDVTDTSGLELLVLLRVVTNLYSNLGNPKTGDKDISGPRWSLLLRLLGEEKHGNDTGITPTFLSRCQNVSKNTISALLRGLETQGLVQRTLDPRDHRIFRIQLSPEGRRLVESSAPQHMQALNALVSNFTVDERVQLERLLTKLYCSLVEQSQIDGNGTKSTFQIHGG
ncbi:MAG: MarR family transcriptional regulator [Anaerolineaceae bacterium]|nr:MarR family transcriptional regulator [Anaerolineaceae bacterium]